MKKIFSIDRAEGDLFVCISDDDEKFDLPRAMLEGFHQNDIFSAEIKGESLENIIAMPEERDRRIAKNKERLARLFNRGNN